MKASLRSTTTRQRGFSLVESLIAIAAIGVLAGIGMAVVPNTKSRFDQAKLTSDVKTINSAINSYLAFHGDLSSAEDPGQVLARLKTVASKNSAKVMPGLTGSFLDKRVVPVMQTPEEAATDMPRAIWHPDRQNFSIATSGPAGVKVFRLDDNLAGAAPATEERSAVLDLASEDTWIWDYKDRTPARPAGPTVIPTTPVPSGTVPAAGVPGASSDPAAPGIGDLQAPLISIPTGEYPIARYPMQVSLTDPNPRGAARLVYSINFGDWADYDGRAFGASPDSVVRAQAIPVDPTEWGSSGFNQTRYGAVPHPLDPPEILPSASIFDNRTSVISVALENPNRPDISQLEYRIGDGAWTAYRGVFNLGADGFPGGAGIEARAIAIADYYEDSEPAFARIGNAPGGLMISGTSEGLFHNVEGQRRLVTNLTRNRSGRFFEWGDPVPLPDGAANNDNIDKAVRQAIENLESNIAEAEAELAVLQSADSPNRPRINELNRQIDNWNAELVTLRTGDGGPGSNGNWASSMVVSGSDFSDVAVGERFRLGIISYYNGTIYSGTGATSVDLTLSIAIEGGETIEFTHTIEMVNSPNIGADPYLSADSVRLSSLASNQRARIGDHQYVLHLEFGESDENGFNTIDEFFVFENETAEGTLYGRLEQVGN